MEQDLEKTGWFFEGGTKETHWIDLYHFEAGLPYSKAAVKWDGCIHLSTVSNEPYEIGEEATEDQCENYTHICNIDEFIGRLESLRDAAKKHFGEDWPR